MRHTLEHFLHGQVVRALKFQIAVKTGEDGFGHFRSPGAGKSTLQDLYEMINDFLFNGGLTFPPMPGCREPLKRSGCLPQAG